LGSVVEAVFSVGEFSVGVVEGTAVGGDEGDDNALEVLDFIAIPFGLE
jgi:hypothetical protein